MDRGYIAKRVEDKIPLPTPVPHHKRNKFRETTRFYQFALFLIPLGTLFIAIGVLIPHWLAVQVVNFVTLKEDYNIGLWEKCDTLKEKCEKRLDTSLKDFEFTVRAFAVSGLVVSVVASVLIVLCVFVPRVAERTLFHVLTSASCYLGAFLSLCSITIYAAEHKINRAYMLSYSFYLILFGAFFGILSSAILINVYVYRKWKYEKRMLRISRRDVHVPGQQNTRVASDYGDDQDDVPSEKRRYSDDDRSRYSDEMSKQSDNFSAKQSEI
ncbi:uncharacterized protein LOC134266511 [Saccostrea cucullata]|uniref:uncharacterized protein LOC134266511 n=1 Tax=Saccostrea cuccullata TaxID=36930 RepID=UPI002ED6BAD9